MNSDLLCIKKLFSLLKNGENDLLTHALTFSSLTYFSNKFISTRLKDIGCNDFRIIDLEKMKCIIVNHNSKTWIAFRGTEFKLLDNWKRILNIIPKRFLNRYEVHGGFELYYSEYADIIQHEIDRYSKKGQEVIFTGHSLGAALASLFNIKYNNSSKCICFASPNILFDCEYDSKNNYCFRIRQDIIPMIPFSLFYIKWNKPCKSIRLWSYKKNYWNLIGYHKLCNYIETILNSPEIQKYKDIK